MTNCTCTPITAPTHIFERELRADRLADLLECLADLLVETGRQRRAIEELSENVDESARDAIRRLGVLEDSVKHVGLEAAAVHQLLQHRHLI